MYCELLYLNTKCVRTQISGSSLVVQWLGLCAFPTEGSGSIPGQGTKILLAAIVQCWEGKESEMSEIELEGDRCCYDVTEYDIVWTGTAVDLSLPEKYIN